MRVRIARPAARDLDDIIDDIGRDDLGAAAGVYHAIDAATKWLGEFPNIGHAGRAPGTREWSVRGLPYIIVYKVGSDALTVLAIFHVARDLASEISARVAVDRGSATRTEMLGFLTSAKDQPPPPGDELD